MSTNKLTTAERYDAIHQRKLRRAQHICLFGTICMVLGLIIYFAPLSQAASTDGEYVIEDSTGIIEDDLIPVVPEYDYAYFSGDPNAGGVWGDPSQETIEQDYNFEEAFYPQASLEERIATVLAMPLDGLEYEPDQVVVTMDQGATEQDIENLVSSTGYYLLDRIDFDAGAAEAMLVLSVGETSDIRQVMADIMRHDGVGDCNLNYIMRVTDEGDWSVDGSQDDAVESWYDDETDEFVAFGESAGAEGDDTQVATDDISFTGMLEVDASIAEVPESESNADADGNITEIDRPEGDGEEDFYTESDTVVTDQGDPSDTRRWDYKALNAEEAWRYSQVNGSLTVAVIDDDFDLNHKDLKGRFVSPYFIEGGTSDLPTPISSHGTHVAGIIAATAGNNYGISGISHNAFIMPVCVRSKDHAKAVDGAIDVGTIANALEYVYKHANDRKNAPVRVVNISIGALYDTSDSGSAKRANGTKQLLAKPIKKLADKQILVVCAAGNEKSNDSKKVHYPSVLSQNYGNVIGVINVQQNGSSFSKAPDSNYNPSGLSKTNYVAQVSAPGTGIYSCASVDEKGNVDHQRFCTMSGTSMASPEVAGTAALLFAANTKLTAKQVRNTLCTTATDLGASGPDIETGYGMINPVAALKSVTGKNYDNKPTEDEKALLKSISVAIDGKKSQKFNPLAKNLVMSIDYKTPVKTAKEPKFTWTYNKNGLTMTSTKGKRKATNENNPRDIGNNQKVIDYEQTYKFTFKQKSGGKELNSYAFKCKTHVLTASAGEKRDNPPLDLTPPDIPATELPTPQEPEPAPSVPAPSVPAPSVPTPSNPGDGSDTDKDKDEDKDKDKNKDKDKDKDDLSSGLPSVDLFTLPHSRITAQWTDTKAETPKRYSMAFPYLDEATPVEQRPADWVSDNPDLADKRLAGTYMFRITKALGKTEPTQSTVTEFFDAVLPTAGTPTATMPPIVISPPSLIDGASGAGDSGDEAATAPTETPAASGATFPSEMTDEKTNDKIIISIVSKKTCKEDSLPGVTDDPVQVCVCRFSIINQTKVTQGMIDVAFWISEKDVATSGAPAAGSSTVTDLVESIAWANHPVTFQTKDESQPIVADIIRGEGNCLTTDDHDVAEGGIVGVSEPFVLAEDGCVSKEKNLNKIVETGDGETTKQIDEHIYSVTIAYPDMTVVDVPKGTAVANSEGTPIIKAVDVTIQTTSAKESPDGMGDNPSNPTPEKPVDPYESLKDMECWIAGKCYTEFVYDKTDYAISFHHGDPFPEAPEMKNIPEEEGWKLESITSGAVLNQDAQRYKVTVANDTTHVSREYTFTYERELGADNNPITQFFGGDTGGNAESTAPRRSLAATGGSLVQTGDAVLIIGGAAIALASGAWILVYGKKKSSEA